MSVTCYSSCSFLTTTTRSVIDLKKTDKSSGLSDRWQAPRTYRQYQHFVLTGQPKYMLQGNLKSLIIDYRGEVRDTISQKNRRFFTEAPPRPLVVSRSLSTNWAANPLSSLSLLKTVKCQLSTFYGLGQGHNVHRCGTPPARCP